MSCDPPQVLFAATSHHAFGGLKDSVKNIQETGEFVVDLAIWELREQMNQSAVAAPSEVDEFEYAGMSKAPAELVAPPWVKESDHDKTQHLLFKDRTSRYSSAPSGEVSKVPG